VGDYFNFKKMFLINYTLNYHGPDPFTVGPESKIINALNKVEAEDKLRRHFSALEGTYTIFVRINYITEDI